MTREEAARVLGVCVDAEPTQVRRAWRVWARLAHPDVGGQYEHFQALATARDVLLGGQRREPTAMPQPQPRDPLRLVCTRPRTPGVLVVAAMACMALAAAVLATLAHVWIAALVMGTFAAGVAVLCVRVFLTPRADVGHKISLLVVTWTPLAVAQIVLAEVLGASVLTALPALTVPIAGAVALVNPGAGLWRALPD